MEGGLDILVTQTLANRGKAHPIIDQFYGMRVA